MRTAPPSPNARSDGGMGADSTPGRVRQRRPGLDRAARASAVAVLAGMLGGAGGWWLNVRKNGYLRKAHGGLAIRRTLVSLCPW